MLRTVMHVVFLTQNLESTRRHSQKVDSGTGNMLWVRMALFHAMTIARPTKKPWFPGMSM